MIKWIIIITIFLIITISGLIIWFFLSKDLQQARNLKISPVNIKKLKDGVYIGEYEGGPYRWRANKVRVTIKKEKITHIEILESAEAQKGTFDHSKLKKRLIEAQSLEIDAISGATLSSKAFLKAVENALRQIKQ